MIIRYQLDEKVVCKIDKGMYKKGEIYTIRAVEYRSIPSKGSYCYWFKEAGSIGLWHVDIEPLVKWKLEDFI